MLGKVSLGFRPGAFPRGANVRDAFHLEPLYYMDIHSSCCSKKMPTAHLVVV